MSRSVSRSRESGLLPKDMPTKHTSQPPDLWNGLSKINPYCKSRPFQIPIQALGGLSVAHGHLRAISGSLTVDDLEGIFTVEPDFVRGNSHRVPVFLVERQGKAASMAISRDQGVPRPVKESTLWSRNRGQWLEEDPDSYGTHDPAE